MNNARTLWSGGVAALLLLLACLPASADVRLVVAPDATRIESGASAIVRLYILNEGPSSIDYTPQAEIAASFVFGDRTERVTLRPVDGTQPITIAPGAFAVLRCTAAVPDGVAPTAMLRIDEPGPGGPPGPPATAEAVAGATDRLVPGVSPTTSADRPATEAGVVEYRPLRFAAYEPIYFLYGTDQPNAKFQISFKYQPVPPDSPVGRKAPWASGFHIAYTQLSFWDLEGDSKPFFDNSYKPELLWLWDDIRPGDWGPISRLDLQLGVQHESNGRSGEDSRSLNIAYVRPTVTFGDRSRWFVSVAPRLWVYLTDMDDNPDIYKFRGYGDLTLVAGKGDGLQVAAIGRIGSDGDKGSLQIDLSYPIRKLLWDSFDIYLHAQLYTGYGESLLLYDESDTTFRVGISLVR